MSASPILVAVALSAVGVLADYFLKRASQAPVWWNVWLAIGTCAYASTAIGWMYVLRHLTFAQVGVVYCSSTILLLVAVGVLCFGENLKPVEVVGVGLAITSVAILNRFA